MTYRLSMAVDENICLEIEEPQFEDVLDLFERMGGEKAWLINAARSAVAASLHGEAVRAVVRSMNGTVAEDTEIPSSASGNGASNGRSASPATGRAGSASGTRTAPPSDPWATDRDEYPGEASVARETLTGPGGGGSDPWGSGTGGATQTRQRPALPARTAPARNDGITVTKDKFGGEWTIGLGEAPDCDCGEPAARLKTTSKAGKHYTVWRCAKATGDAWRDKCSFSQFPS
jgi:hypothetical protein